VVVQAYRLSTQEAEAKKKKKKTKKPGVQDQTHGAGSEDDEMQKILSQ
jgi:hypothetical protein